MEKSYERRLRQEEFILEVTEEMVRAMQEAGLRKADIAERLGCSKSLVTQMLDGGRNLTLRTVADFAGALNLMPRVRLCSEVDWVASFPLSRLEVRPVRAKVLAYPQAEVPAIEKVA